MREGPVLSSWVDHLYGSDLRGFVGRHAHRGPPMREPGPVPRRIVGDRATATYGAHPYWSKKPHELVLACLRAFTRPGDLVLDPFAGSGGVPVLAAALGRPAIAIDRSPAAAFIVDALAKVDSETDIPTNVRAVIEAAGVRDLYATRCHHCGGPAETQFAVWRDLLRCPACGRVYARPAGRRPLCPLCGHGRSGHADRVGERVEEIAAVCRSVCVPGQFRRRFDDAAPAVRRYWRRFDAHAALKVRPWAVRAPRVRFPAGIKTAELFARGIRRVDQMFTARNLVAMARIREAIDGMPRQAHPGLRVTWHAALIGTSLKAQHLQGGGGYLPAMYYVPPVRKERNVGVTLHRIAGRLSRAVRSYPRAGAPSPVHAAVGDARDLSAIAGQTVDYVFLDPPYDEKIQYAELNFLWEAWLGADDDWREDDLVVNQARGQGLPSWQASMRRVIAECARVLKPGGWLSLTYVPGARASAEALWTAFEAVGFERRPELDGVVLNRQRTYVQRTSRAAARDQVVHFRLAR